MTVGNTLEATASTEESEDTTAKAEDQVAQAVQDVETEGEPAPEVTPEPEQPSFATVDDVRTEIGHLQGRISQRAGQDTKDLTGRLDRLEGMLTQMADNSFEDRLAGMEPEAQAEALRKEVTRLRTPQEPAAPAPQQDGVNQWGLTPAEQATLASRVQGMIDGMEIEGVTPHSPEIWAGAQNVQTADQLMTLVRQNLGARKPAPVKTTAAPAAPATITNSADVPVTTQGAPASPAGVYDTLADISTALSNGEVTTQFFREWMRDRNLGQNG